MAKRDEKIGKGKTAEVIEISDSDFDDFIKSGNIVFVDFFAEWCMPCVMMVPVIEELAKAYSGKIKFAKMNIDENHKTAERFKIMSIPTMMIFKKGEPVQRVTGALSQDMLKEKIDNTL